MIADWRMGFRGLARGFGFDTLGVFFFCVPTFSGLIYFTGFFYPSL